MRSERLPEVVARPLRVLKRGIVASWTYQRLRGESFRRRQRGKAEWTCPICGYRGPFRDLEFPYCGLRMHAECPRCSARERHRLQHLAMAELISRRDPSKLTFLHFAPEVFFRERFRRKFGTYLTADLESDHVDVKADLRDLHFADESFDVVFASHVLEHIEDDRRAIAEIRRVLRPGGFAVLPVPMVEERTVEYPEPNLHEVGHWRAPGPDYYDRYREVFSRVETYDSSMYPPEFQLYVYEDRSRFPTVEQPLRSPSPRTRHIDIVPVCYR